MGLEALHFKTIFLSWTSNWFCMWTKILAYVASSLNTCCSINSSASIWYSHLHYTLCPNFSEMMILDYLGLHIYLIKGCPVLLMEGHLFSEFGSWHTCMEIFGHLEDFDYPVQVCLIRVGANLVKRWLSGIKMGDQVHDSLLSWRFNCHSPILIICLIYFSTGLSVGTVFNAHIGNACNEMSVSANTKQNSLLRMLSICLSYKPTSSGLKTAKLTAEAVGVFSVSVHGVSSISVLSFSDSRCGGRLTVQ